MEINDVVVVVVAAVVVVIITPLLTQLHSHIIPCWSGPPLVKPIIDDYMWRPIIFP